LRDQPQHSSTDEYHPFFPVSTLLRLVQTTDTVALRRGLHAVSGALHGLDEFFGNPYHLNAEDEPEHPDYPKDPTFKARFGPRGVLK
jgi:arylsulfatase A-like enzyme